VFMIPYFLWVRNPKPTGVRTSVATALSRLWASIKGLPAKRSLATYLGSSMLYRDALNGLYSFGGTFALLVLDFSVVQVGVFGIIAAIGASVFSYVGGRADTRFGPKPVVITSIWVLIGVCFMLVNLSRDSMFGIQLTEGSMAPDIVFYICGVLIGGMGGVMQASSRTLMVRHCDMDAPTKSFGLYGLTGRATAFIAPFLIGVATTVTGNTQLGVSPLLALFLLGLIMLRWVNPKGEPTA
jgi:UMF1 family MFS transporter